MAIKRENHSGSGRLSDFLWIYSNIFPSIENVTTCHGMNLPLFFNAVIAACSSPPQHGTSMRSTVTLLISFPAMISVSLASGHARSNWSRHTHLTLTAQSCWSQRTVLHTLTPTCIRKMNTFSDRKTVRRSCILFLREKWKLEALIWMERSRGCPCWLKGNISVRLNCSYVIIPANLFSDDMVSL